MPRAATPTCRAWVLPALVLTVCSAPGAAEAEGAEKGTAAVGTTMTKVEYRGWKNNLKIANGEAELVVTLDVGPRVISYKLAGGTNVLKNYDELMGQSGEADWKIRGGHRLWTSPEDTGRTYAPDNGPVAYKELGPGRVRLTPAPLTEFGVQKEIDLTLDPSGTKVTLLQRITNIGHVPTDLAVWSLTVMAPGGIEVIPLPPKRPHPGDVKNAKSAADFAPNQLFSFWPFVDFQDARYGFGTNALTLRQDPKKGATKIGLLHKTGGVGYLNGGTLFVKRFGHLAGKPYPDNGVNYETYTDENMLEMESLGPLTTLAPGQAVEHTETWELFGNVGDKIEADVLPRLK